MLWIVRKLEASASSVIAIFVGVSAGRMPAQPATMMLAAMLTIISERTLTVVLFRILFGSNAVDPNASGTLQ